MVNKDEHIFETSSCVPSWVQQPRRLSTFLCGPIIFITSISWIRLATSLSLQSSVTRPDAKKCANVCTKYVINILNWISQFFA